MIKSFFSFMLMIGVLSCKKDKMSPVIVSQYNAYYFSASGNDITNTGSKGSPWKTIGKFNSLKLNSGDTVFFEGGKTFIGNIFIDPVKSGTVNRPVVITSYGTGKAIINSGDTIAINLYRAKYIKLINLSFVGSGRKTGNTHDGVSIVNCSNIFINDLNINGFQKSGLLIHSSSDIEVYKVHAFENGYAGITVQSDSLNTNCKNIIISHCTAENNPGDPTNLINHSGNGIIVSHCTNLLIEYCTATNNGWDMPRVGNGPVGIWAWEADSVIIDHCISYRNKTSNGGEDGGGFDFDGGITNSVIQYCLSYENYGSGIGLFEFYGAKPWFNNTVRYNISVNDGLVSAAKAGIYIWNASATYNLMNCYIYNNVIYNANNAAINYASQSKNEGFVFYNNIFVGRDNLIAGKDSSAAYLANNWWNLSGGFNIGGIKDFSAWATTNNKEQLNGNIVGLNIEPEFKNTGSINLTNPDSIDLFFNYQIPPTSALKNKGLNLKETFGIETGNLDFNGKLAPPNGIGASF